MHIWFVIERVKMTGDVPCIAWAFVTVSHLGHKMSPLNHEKLVQYHLARLFTYAVNSVSRQSIAQVNVGIITLCDEFYRNWEKATSETGVCLDNTDINSSCCKPFVFQVAQNWFQEQTIDLHSPLIFHSLDLYQMKHGWKIQNTT